MVPACDFCSVQAIRYSYPVKTFNSFALIHPKTKNMIIGGSVDDWAACEICHSLIEADNRKQLAQRTWDMLESKFKSLITLDFILHMHAGFFANRLGPAKALGNWG